MLHQIFIIIWEFFLFGSDTHKCFNKHSERNTQAVHVRYRIAIVPLSFSIGKPNVLLFTFQCFTARVPGFLSVPGSHQCTLDVALQAILWCICIMCFTARVPRFLGVLGSYQCTVDVAHQAILSEISTQIRTGIYTEIYECHMNDVQVTYHFEQ